MPPRPSIPDDDLYETLGLPADASMEAIDVAWRGLLRRHHPDVAGDAGLAAAKRINVAHDWLSDPELRQRYDDTRQRPRWAIGARGDSSSGAAGRAGMPVRRPRRQPTTGELVDAVVTRVARLGPDELDRLALAEPAPIAFLATLRRFVPAELGATLDDAARRALGALVPAAQDRPAIRDAIEGQLAAIVLADTLDDLLGEAGAERARERLTRGWDAAVGMPRYGPATDAVGTLLAKLRTLQPADVTALAATGGREGLGETPWPVASSPEEDEALRVSSDLAAADAMAELASAPPAARRAAARIAHLLVLRHAFAEGSFERHAAPWLGGLIPTLAQARRPVRPRR